MVAVAEIEPQVEVEIAGERELGQAPGHRDPGIPDRHRYRATDVLDPPQPEEIAW